MVCVHEQIFVKVGRAIIAYCGCLPLLWEGGFRDPIEERVATFVVGSNGVVGYPFGGLGVIIFTFLFGIVDHGSWACMPRFVHSFSFSDLNSFLQPCVFLP